MRKFAFCILPFAFALSASAQLAQDIDTLIAAPPFDHAIWGIDVEDDAGNVLYAHNAQVLMIPASNRKLFAAATVANCFGFDHQFTTELWVDGAHHAILRGGGDPSLGGRWAFDRNAVFAPFVAALRGRHIRSVSADVSAFDRTTIPGSWKYGNLGAEYAAPIDALTYNENVVGVVVDNCKHPVVTTDPPFVKATADARCGNGETTMRTGAKNDVTITGVLPEHVQELIAITDPGLYAAQALAAQLHARVTSGGRPRKKVTEIESPPLWQLLSVMLKPSQNLYAETLFKDLSYDRPASYAASLDVERTFLKEVVGIDEREFRFVDGSGLAPDDLVAPEAVVKILRWMNAPARRGAWWMLLAVPGEPEGTLRRRLVELAPRLRGKTGSIAGVNALSGIVAGRDGRFRYFSIIINHHTGDSGEALKVIDAIAREIAAF